MEENGISLRDLESDRHLSVRTIGIDFERRFDKRNPEYLVGQGAAGSGTTMPLPNVDIPPEKHLILCKLPARLNKT
jgi:hypothetical protein